jgi:PPK2 family polyphosphate:nucleotide phosphotransferase
MGKSTEYKIKPGAKVGLDKIPADDEGGLDRERAQAEFEGLKLRLITLQEMMYAQSKHSLLVILQAMDTGGKDSTIRSVFGGVDPQGCHVVNFKAPNDAELSRDFLWRVHPHVPARGYITVFNRSHYEDVLIARVKGLVDDDRWKRRYEHINAFEKMLSDEGTMILKFYLHIGRDYQKDRLIQRLERPEKRWKFDPSDLTERTRWGDYQRAYEDVFRKCSTEWAPWYVVPSERRWYRDLVIARILVSSLRSLDIRYPEPTFDPSKIVIED